MNEIFILLLPVLWMVVATIVGLLLYKSSQAIFIQDGTSKGNTKRKVLFAGSALIAAVAFFGMKWATPRDLLGGIPETSIVVGTEPLDRLFDSAVEIDQTRAALEGTIATYSPGTGSAETMKLRELTADLKSKISVIRDGEKD